MTQTVVHAVRLSKRYRAASHPRGSIDALDGVSFDVESGEAVGILGRNGAGKSTLLKVLSRVTRPSAGYADLAGRVGALLEVGTGFHPDLTGRENTYLSGAMLGLSRRDISSRYDQIVDFSEISDFMDEPVKHYSSGMYARLGFAVAAHLLPEVLIIDEVLSVGDLPFQAKCLALMRSLTARGTTVLFVSHNLLALSDLCPRAMVIDRGRLVFDGPTPEAVRTYRRSLELTASSDAQGEAPPHEVRVEGHARDSLEITPNSSLTIALTFVEPRGVPRGDLELNLHIERGSGGEAVHLRNDLADQPLTFEAGSNSYRIEIADLPLSPGTYSFWLRMVSFDPRTPRLWDTERIPLVVVGDERRSALVHPRHRFVQVSTSG